MAALVDLLVLDRDNPRSVAWVAHTLRGRLAKLAGSEPQELSALALKVPNPNIWGLAQLCDLQVDLASPDFDQTPDTRQAGDVAAVPRFELLKAVLQQCTQAAFDVSDEISATYFTHSGLANRSVGAT
jgi:uncharacterized alpha-E superfamily protein